MTTVIWKSEQRVIPGYGEATPGMAIDLPENLAQQFIAQGQAEKAVTRGDQKSRRTNQVDEE